MANRARKTNKVITPTKKKGLSDKTKHNLKVGFGTLISNNCVVEAGRTFHWWIPILLGLLSAMLALVPNLVNGMRTDVGTNFIGSNTYGFENGLVQSGNYLEENKSNVSFVIENKELKVTGWNSDFWFSYKGDGSNPVIDSESSEQTTVVTPTKNVGFEVFYNDSTVTGISDNDYRVRVLKNCNPLTDTARTDNPDGNTTTIYRTNFIIFNKTNFVYGKFPRNAKTNGSTYIGYYDGVKSGYNLLDLFTLKEGTAKGSKTATEEIVANWKTFFTKSYESTKTGSVWSMTGIMFGVNIGVILLFGFVIWLMTRGKNNPFRSVRVIEAFCMAGWAAPSCAILSMFGFLLAGYASFIFIFLFGIRIMWMSMRALRPYEPAK